MLDDRAELRKALTLEPLLGEALRQAGATGFRDEGFIANLEKVLEIPTRLDLSERGLQGMLANNLRWLTNRLRWEADVAAHPEILDEDVSDPIIVLGLPRSGTTKLQRFLSADPNLQATPAWSMWNPAPLPGEQPKQPPLDPTPRIEWAARMMGFVTNTGETYQKMHEFAAREADESSFVPLANFDYVMQFTTAPDHAYLEWVRGVDRRSPLSFLKSMLQYLQWQGSGRRGPWLLKNPGHTGEVAELADLFPRATFVISQRDLTTTMGSSFRMMGEILANTFDQPDPRRYANETVEYWSYELNRYQAQRAELGDRVRVLEIPYRRCVEDAPAVARELYALHGIPLTEQGEAAMREWEVDNPRHKLGGYDYRLEDYGWTAAQVEQAFGPIAEAWRGS